MHVCVCVCPNARVSTRPPASRRKCLLQRARACARTRAAFARQGDGACAPRQSRASRTACFRCRFWGRVCLLKSLLSLFRVVSTWGLLGVPLVSCCHTLWVCPVSFATRQPTALQPQTKGRGQTSQHPLHPTPLFHLSLQTYTSCCGAGGHAPISSPAPFVARRRWQEMLLWPHTLRRHRLSPWGAAQRVLLLLQTASIVVSFFPNLSLRNQTGRRGGPVAASCCCFDWST